MGVYCYNFYKGGEVLMEHEYECSDRDLYDTSLIVEESTSEDEE